MKASLGDSLGLISYDFEGNYHFKARMYGSVPYYSG